MRRVERTIGGAEGRSRLFEGIRGSPWNSQSRPPSVSSPRCWAQASSMSLHRRRSAIRRDASCSDPDPGFVPAVPNRFVAPAPGRPAVVPGGFGFRPQFQPQQFARPQQFAPPQQFAQPQHFAVQQAHAQVATGLAFNRSSQSWEQRQGRTVYSRSGRRIWYQVDVYDGAPYVFVDNVGFVEMDGPQWSQIYADLESGDPDTIETAMALIIGDAEMQGLIPVASGDDEAQPDGVE